jgi:hypothetical protein
LAVKENGVFPAKETEAQTNNRYLEYLKERGGVYTEIVDDCTRSTLQAIIRGKIDPKTVIVANK